jgi:plastocyanin
MRKRLLSFVCISGLLATGPLFWNQSARAADDPKTINIVLGAAGPVFAEENVTISAGQTIKWVPKTKNGVPHHLVQIMPDGTDGPSLTGEEDFTNPDGITNTDGPTHKFETPGVVKVQCIRHRGTMNQTITVTP